MPPIFVINLDRDIERMRMIAENLNALGLSYIRVPAILGKAVLNREKIINSKLYSMRNRLPMPRDGEVGCYLSHLKALGAFLETNEPWCIILEDDIKILPECIEIIDSLPKEDDWDLVKLFCFHSGTPIQKRSLTKSHHLVVHLTRTTSSAAYIVNRKAAKILLRSLLPITEQIDHAIERPWETGLRIRGVRPLPAILAPIASISTIGYDKQNNPETIRRRSFFLSFSRAYKEFRRFIHGISEGLLH